MMMMIWLAKWGTHILQCKKNTLWIWLNSIVFSAIHTRRWKGERERKKYNQISSLCIYTSLNDDGDYDDDDDDRIKYKSNSNVSI